MRRQSGRMEAVVQVLNEASAGQPVDACLRRFFQRTRSIPAQERTQIAHSVFAYYRWHGWLDRDTRLPDQILQARQCAQDFHRYPKGVSVEALRNRAVPPWVNSALPEVPTDWLKSLQREPTLWLRTRSDVGLRVRDLLGGESLMIAGPFPDCWRYAGFEDLFRHPAFHEGGWEIQDVASQAVTRVANPLPGQHWWDVCAGEGGKTLHLAQQMEGRGLVWATDRAVWRLDRLRRRAARAGTFNIRVEDEISHPDIRARRFHGILVDAPCSGVGTWGRNPQARWTTRPEDVTELAALQRQILESVVERLKPGGRLIYAVCTLTRAETVEVAEWIARQFGFLKPVPFENPFSRKSERTPSSTSSEAAQFWWPQATGGNGMFVAMWQKPG